MRIPRTPRECTLPRPNVLRTTGEGKDGRGRFRQKVAGRCTQNPWITRSTAPKSLIVYKCGPTGCPSFSTGRAAASTGRPVFSTCPIFAVFRPCLSISLFLKKKRREKEPGEKNGHPRVFHVAYFLIHGFPPHSTPDPWKSVEAIYQQNHGDKCYG